MKVHINSLRKYSMCVASGNGSLRKSHSVCFFIKYKGRRKFRCRADCAECDLTITAHCVAMELVVRRRRDSIVHSSPYSWDESDGNTSEQTLYKLVWKLPSGTRNFLSWWKCVICKRNVLLAVCACIWVLQIFPLGSIIFLRMFFWCHQMWYCICAIWVLHSVHFED
jgi:hypothetical protein